MTPAHSMTMRDLLAACRENGPASIRSNSVSEARQALASRLSPSTIEEVLRALVMAHQYILDNGDDRTMAPQIERLEVALNLLNQPANKE